MATDVKLDEGDGSWITLEANIVKSTSSDLMLDSPARRKGAGGRYRRALVHSDGDALTVNYNGDYPGGTRIVDARLNLKPEEQEGATPVLPTQALLGEIRMIINVSPGAMGTFFTTTSLWLCVPSESPSAVGRAYWRQITLGPLTGS